MNKIRLLVLLSLVFSFSLPYSKNKISSYVDVVLSQILYEVINLEDLSFEEEKFKEKFTHHLESYFLNLDHYSLENLSFIFKEKEIKVDITYSHYLITYNLKKVGKIDEKNSWNNSFNFDYDG